MTNLTFPDDYIIKTNRLILRPPLETDVDGLWNHVTNPTITEFLAWNPHENQEMTLSLLKSLIQAQKDEKGYHWVLVQNKNLLGIVSLIDVRRQHRCWILDRAELAYWLGVEYQKQGLMTEACQAVVTFAFNTLKLHKILVYHASDNPPSGAVIKRLGFRYVGKELEAFCKDGKWHNLKQYEMLEREFTQINDS